jgi:integrase
LQRQQQKEQTTYEHFNQKEQKALEALFDRKVDLITAGLQPRFNKYLKDEGMITRDNAHVICDYIIAMNTEINPSSNYRQTTIQVLVQLSKFLSKPFNLMTREDVLAFLDRLRKPESLDPMHKWVGTYNIYTVQLKRFFKWLYSPDIESDKRQMPKVVENIPRLKRKEKSIYKPDDLWTNEEDLIFLRYCPSRRIKCYHFIIRDTGCRPNEILKLKIKDVVFKSVNDRQYAEIMVNGKTGTRNLPLIDSIPYIKDYLSYEHPISGNPNSPFICGEGKSLGRSISGVGLYHVYDRYKEVVFPKLLDNPNVPPEDKQKIRALLRKPWNPYVVGRHATLTHMSRRLKEATLRVFAGWTPDSDMPKRYTHHFGNAACEDILEEYGLLDKGIRNQANLLKSKQCPQCSEMNKHDSKFCAKCRMVLSYDAYQETLKEQEKQRLNADELELLKQKIAEFDRVLGLD